MTEQQIKDILAGFINLTEWSEKDQKDLDEAYKKYTTNLEKQEMLNKHSYKPLPYNLEILDSPIEGQGLFLVNADETLEMGTLLGDSHYLLEGGELFRTPLGGFINHSDHPNCVLQWEDDIAYLVTETEVEPGEELTLNYFNELCGVEEVKCTLEPYIETGILKEETCCKQSPCTVIDWNIENPSYNINGKPVTLEEYYKGLDETSETNTEAHLRGCLTLPDTQPPINTKLTGQLLLLDMLGERFVPEDYIYMINDKYVTVNSFFKQAESFLDTSNNLRLIFGTTEMLGKEKVVNARF